MNRAAWQRELEVRDLSSSGCHEKPNKANMAQLSFLPDRGEAAQLREDWQLCHTSDSLNSRCCNSSSPSLQETKARGATASWQQSVTRIRLRLHP